MTVRVRYEGVTTLARQLGEVPKELRRELRPKIRQAGRTVEDRIRANAAWSRRIPAAVSTNVRFRAGGKGGGITVHVDSIKAPHGRPLEFGSEGRRNINRHPVFGHRGRWVNQPTRPFFMPAIRESNDDVVRLVQSAIDEALGTVNGRQ